ncbi:MAG: beta-ketoacyl-ACP synthase III [Gammaproteobacteria bacterium]
MVQSVAITGTGVYVPPEVINNKELVDCFNHYVAAFNETNKEAIAAGECEPLQESSDAFIVKASGIKQRHVITREGVLDPCDMVPHLPQRSREEGTWQKEFSCAAAEGALKEAGIMPEDIDGVIMTCSNVERPFPSIAIEVQEAMGIKGFGFDMNVACSSATFALVNAKALIQSGMAKRILIVNPELASPMIDYRVRDNHFIFGDAASAMVVESADVCAGDQGFTIGSEQLVTQYSENIRSEFGFLNQWGSNLGKRVPFFIQEGRKVFKEVVPMVENHIRQHLKKVGKDIKSVARFWLHQANANMNTLIMQRLLGDELEEKRAPQVLAHYANTGSAGSIIAFHENKNDLTQGDLGVLCSFGAGYSIGSLLLEKR